MQKRTYESGKNLFIFLKDGAEHIIIGKTVIDRSGGVV